MIISELQRNERNQFGPTGRTVFVKDEDLTSEWPHIQEAEGIATKAFGNWDGIDLNNGAQSLFTNEGNLFNKD